MEILISDHFKPLLDVEERYLVVYGGRGSGKSEFVGRKLFYRCMVEGGHHILVVRKVARDNDGSTVRVMQSILEQNKIRYEYNKTSKELRFASPYSGKPNLVDFDGMDNRERLKSKKGITSIWIEEATALTADDFLQVDLILRDPTPYYKQIILSFNPDEALAAWIKEDFFEDEAPRIGPGKKPDSYLHWSVVEHNPIKRVRDDYLRTLEGVQDPVKRKIYLKGLWALAKGIIYDWPVDNGFDAHSIDWFDEIWYGIDFGFSVDPAAVVRIYRKADHFWVQQVIYERGLTNVALADRMADADVTDDETLYCDSAEPKSIQELYDNGFNAHPALKGPDSVRAGIDFLKGLRISIVPGSPDLLAERKTYKWAEDKDGHLLAKPVDFDNHAMDAIRYAIYTHMRGMDNDADIMWIDRDEM